MGDLYIGSNIRVLYKSKKTMVKSSPPISVLEELGSYWVEQLKFAADYLGLSGRSTCAHVGPWAHASCMAQAWTLRCQAAKPTETTPLAQFHVMWHADYFELCGWMWDPGKTKTANEV